MELSGGPASTTGREVVVAFADGKQKRGFVTVLNPDKPTFHLHGRDPSGISTTSEIRFDQVKMVAFLRRADTPEVTYPAAARVVTLRFNDGHVIRGLTETYAGARAGMYVIPLRVENFERVFVPVAAIREVIAIQKLGDVLVEQGAVTPTQAEQAAQRQREVQAEPLGEILVRNNVITTQQLTKSLELQSQYAGTKKIGEILLEQGFVDGSQIEEAVEAQKVQRRKRFGEILVDMGFATYKMIAIALAMQCNVPFLDLSTQSYHPQLASLVPAAFARRWQIMPINFQQGTLTIAVTDPIDHPALEELRKMTGFTVIMVIATPQDIVRAIAGYYGKAAPRTAPR